MIVKIWLFAGFDEIKEFDQAEKTNIDVEDIYIKVHSECDSLPSSLISKERLVVRSQKHKRVITVVNHTGVVSGVTFSDWSFFFAVVTVLGHQKRAVDDLINMMRFIEEEHSVVGKTRLEHASLCVEDFDRG